MEWGSCSTKKQKRENHEFYAKADNQRETQERLLEMSVGAQATHGPGLFS